MRKFYFQNYKGYFHTINEEWIFSLKIDYSLLFITRQDTKKYIFDKDIKEVLIRRTLKPKEVEEV